MAAWGSIGEKGRLEASPRQLRKGAEGMVQALIQGLPQFGFHRRLRERLTVASIALSILGFISVSDGLAANQYTGASDSVAPAAIASSPSTPPGDLVNDAPEATTGGQQAARTVAQQARSNVDDPGGLSTVAASEVASNTESMDNGVLVVRHGQTKTPESNPVGSGDAPATYELAIACGNDSPWPCHTLEDVRGPAEGFHKRERWAYHRLSFQYHPTDFTYHRKDKWTYQSKQVTSRYSPLDIFFKSPYLDLRLVRR